MHVTWIILLSPMAAVVAVAAGASACGTGTVLDTGALSFTQSGQGVQVGGVAASTPVNVCGGFHPCQDEPFGPVEVCVPRGCANVIAGANATLGGIRLVLAGVSFGLPGSHTDVSAVDEDVCV